MHETGCSKPVHWDNPKEWDGEGGGKGVSGWGTGVYLWRIHVDVWQKPIRYYKVINLQNIQAAHAAEYQKSKLASN